jgi:adenine-specific DNA-methyltransferase
MARAKKPTGPKPVDSLKHKDKRTNIPTNELRGFVESDEAAPASMLYPRDRSLDPQLVWQGKDKADREPLEVPVVPIYIQEKILPQVIIENLRDTARKGEPEPEMKLFDDYDGIEFQELVEFYRHEQNWANRMILGDSLLVMTSLAEKEGLKGKVQMIYMDPPYGIKFGSNWQVSTRKRDVKDGKAEDATRQPEQIKAFRDTWELGIHSYLAYLRDRLVVTRELLSETGSIFVQIGDENVHLVRAVMDEVLGSENFIVQIVLKTTSGAGSPSGGTLTLPHVHDYLLCYARDISRVKYRQLFADKSEGTTGGGLYQLMRLPDGTVRRMTPTERADRSMLPEGARLFRPDNLTSQSSPEVDRFEVEYEGGRYRPGRGGWKTNATGMARLIAARRLWPTRGGTIQYVRYLEDFPVMPLTNVWTDVGTGSFTEDKIFVVQTNTKVIQRCLLMATDPGDLVLDPTCGSGTTAAVAEQWGRRWITVDTSRVSLALARSRLMGARFPYYTLADSPEGAKREAELTGVRPATVAHSHDVRRGFVYKRVPHIQLKSIANNPDIREGMSRDEIDSAIRRYADTELLYDQPYEDPSRIRVTGPFTVESLSPHRMLAGTDGTDSDSVGVGLTASASDAADFVSIILDNLRKAGVQNTYKNERLVFERIESYAGTYVQAVGEYTDAAGKTMRAAISIGPEYGTVDATWVKEAAKEARRGEGFPMLVVCAFAFGPYVNEETRQWSNLTILITRMNPDLAMDTADQKLLKSTGAGNLFMVFGEPDLELRTLADGKLQVELRGLDVYDPTTGEIRSSSTDDIACWFIDSDYNEESFFVRHAYFTGADEPYKKLQRALKSEINEEAWASLYSTVSRPFDPPSTHKIAVKVINHYGDEVLKVYPCATLDREVGSTQADSRVSDD